MKFNKNKALLKSNKNKKPNKAKCHLLTKIQIKQKY